MPGRSRQGKFLQWTEVLVCSLRFNSVCGSTIQPGTSWFLNHHLGDQQLMFPSGTLPSESPDVKYLLNIREQPTGIYYCMLKPKQSFNLTHRTSEIHCNKTEHPDCGAGAKTWRCFAGKVVGLNFDTGDGVWTEFTASLGAHLWEVSQHLKLIKTKKWACNWTNFLHVK